MQYQDFRIELSSDGKRFEARVYAEGEIAGGSRAEVMGPAQEEELRLRLEKLDADLLDLADARAKGKEGIEERVKKLKTEQADFGRWLRRELFREKVGVSFERCRGALGDAAGPDGLRIRIAWHESDEGVLPLVASPWELLDDAQGGALGYRRRFPLSRYLQADGAIHPLRLDHELRVLMVEANPSDLSPIDGAAEKAEIRKAIEGIDGVAVAEAGPDLLEVRDAILDYGIHVLHFMGHGYLNPATGEAHVTFCDAEGKALRHPADFVADRLKDLPTLRAVVLSNCYGGALPRGSGHSPYGAVAPALLRAEIPVVVAMQFAVTDRAAATFARRFYGRLVRGDAVDVAAAEARLEIEGLQSPQGAGLEWPLPTVYTRVEDPRILVPRDASVPFRTDPDSGHGPDPTPGDRNGPLKVGIRSFGEGFGRGMENEMDRLLDLGSLLDGSRSAAATSEGRPEPASTQLSDVPSDAAMRRLFRRENPGQEVWNGDVRAELIHFLRQLRTVRNPIDLHLAAHGSVAYTAGWVLEAKSGLDLRIWQRGQEGAGFFLSEEGEVPEGELWTFEEEARNENSSDVAVAVAITREVAADVRAYLQSEAAPKVGRLILATIEGGPDQRAVTSGAHALRLAQTLARRIRERTLAERKAGLHLFWSAPNAFAVYLGQQSRAFGRLRLYEYPFGNTDAAGVYWPSISLPPE